MKRNFFLSLCLGCGAGAAIAAVDLSELQGYTLSEEKTIVGRIDDGEYEDGYKGCKFRRVLVFQDETGVECAEYNYQYAYRPKASIFVRGSSMKIVVDDNIMDVRPMR